MEVISDIALLQARIEACNEVFTREGDDALRRMFETFRGDFSGQVPADPFGAEYRAFQLGLYERICGRPYTPHNERSHFDVEAALRRPFPYVHGSLPTVGEHLLAIGVTLRHMGLKPGSRVVEFGPGWGNTTLALAMSGFRVTAVDIEPNFCELLRRRAAQHQVEIEVVEADFFWAESVTRPYDAALFFEAFHHCDDHLRLLRALRGAVKPDGLLVLGAEPVVPDYGVPWGISMAGIALWSMRNFGWLELGFDEAYFRAALARTGWDAVQHRSADLYWATVWQARQAPPDVPAAPAAPAPVPTTAAPSLGVPRTAREAELEREIAALHASTSWRMTAPLRGLRRLLG